LDDALKELDEERRKAFWKAIPDDCQVLYASAHDQPKKEDSWVILEISPGAVETRAE
jgi:recombinational DNA repair ATPase RecF